MWTKRSEAGTEEWQHRRRPPPTQALNRTPCRAERRTTGTPPAAGWFFFGSNFRSVRAIYRKLGGWLHVSDFSALCSGEAPGIEAVPL